MDNKIKSSQSSNVEGAVLSNLWKKVLAETNLVNALDFLITKYVDQSNHSMKVQKRRTKSSLTKNIYSDDMTWKTFVDLMFNFLKIKRIELVIKLHHPNNDVTMHSITFKPDNNANKDEIDKKYGDSKNEK